MHLTHRPLPLLAAALCAVAAAACGDDTPIGPSARESQTRLVARLDSLHAASRQANDDRALFIEDALDAIALGARPGSAEISVGGARRAFDVVARLNVPAPGTGATGDSILLVTAWRDDFAEALTFVFHSNQYGRLVLTQGAWLSPSWAILATSHSGDAPVALVESEERACSVVQPPAARVVDAGVACALGDSRVAFTAHFRAANGAREDTDISLPTAAVPAARVVRR